MLHTRAPSALLREPIMRTFLQHTSPSQLLTQRQPILQKTRAFRRTFTSIPSQARSQLQQTTSQTRPFLLRNIARKRPSSGRRFNSTQPPSAAQSQAPPQGISARFKELSRKYGWAALGVYMGLSVLDFPFCFLAVRLIGTDRIGEAEHVIAHAFWSVVGAVVPSMQPGERKKHAVAEGAGIAGEDEHDNASIWTQLLLAYGVHKSLIFFRVPLTAAVTPKVVKTLRSWGWNIGPRTKAAASSAAK